ncbi:MAG: hypothetical protein P4L11_02040 [Geothrix sp.]|nr:hypothetical protein [Geothrix sp.]
MRRNINLFVASWAFLLMAFALACSGGSSSTTNSTNNTSNGPAPTYELWKGSISNTYYSLNIYGDRALQVTGKPWMVIKRDPITLLVLDCEFGFSEVTQTQIPNPNLPGSPEPTLAATAIDYCTQLQLDTTKPVTLCVAWGSKPTLVNGVNNFTFKTGSSPGGVGYNESWSFSLLSSTLWGDVTNIDKTYYLGIDSDSKAFSLSKL